MGQSLYRKCKKLNILFVEDYIPLQKKIASVLDDYFEFVQVASNGEDALEKYIRFKQDKGSFFDIVMTDYEMPILNGIELIKEIKKYNKNQLIIVISAHQKPEYLIEFINLNILHFVSKPIVPEIMLTVLDKASDLIHNNDELFYFNDEFIWNKNKKSLSYKNQQLTLAKYDLLLIEVLLDDFKHICTMDKILNHFYIHNEDIKQDNIRNMIVRLKKKLPEIEIKSYYGLGYQIIIQDSNKL